MLVLLAGLVVWRVFPQDLPDYLWAVEVGVVLLAVCAWMATVASRARKGQQWDH